MLTRPTQPGHQMSLTLCYNRSQQLSALDVWLSRDVPTLTHGQAQARRSSAWHQQQARQQGQCACASVFPGCTASWATSCRTVSYASAQCKPHNLPALCSCPVPPGAEVDCERVSA
jgi:hypothetical protein